LHVFIFYRQLDLSGDGLQTERQHFLPLVLAPFIWFFECGLGGDVADHAFNIDLSFLSLIVILGEMQPIDQNVEFCDMVVEEHERDLDYSVYFRINLIF
jgi:hypothetical protein